MPPPTTGPTAEGDTPPLVPDGLTVRAPLGARALIASDLHLGALADQCSEAASTELARQLEGWSGAGVFVLAGDCLSLIHI